MDRTQHWEKVYGARLAHELGWYQTCPDASLSLIERLGVRPDEAIIDVGGGASNLVDHLLGRGFQRLSVLDISAAALAAAQARLGTRAAEVTWLTGDVTQFVPPGHYALWHDRAVFHFLTEAAERRRYADILAQAVPPGGYAIVATFAEDGPAQCSNLPVCRYRPEQLHHELGEEAFELIESLHETHTTPSQGKQPFMYGCFRRRGAG